MTALTALRIAERLMLPVWWLMTCCRWITPWRHSGTRRRQVLLVGHNELMARYLGEVAEALGDDARIDLRFARSQFVDRHVPSSIIAERVGVPTVGFLWALLKWWDLIITAEHYPCALFHPAIKKMRVTHGLYAGGIVGGSDYVYGERVFRANGKLLYSAMLVAGPTAQRCALEVNPRLDGVVRIAGELLVDRLLEHQKQREDVRRRLGVAADEKVLLIMSSWGERSLIQTIGRELIEEAQRLTDDYFVLVSIHPNNYSRGKGGQDWEAFLSSYAGPRLQVVGRFEPWFDYLTAADIVISDYTSLSLYFAQLLRPLLYVPCNMDTFTPGSPLPRLYGSLPRLAQAGDLRDALRGAVSDYPFDVLEAETREMVAFKGQAHQQLRNIVHDLLGLAKIA